MTKTLFQHATTLTAEGRAANRAAEIWTCLVPADAVPGQRDERVLEGAAAGLLSQCRSGALGDDPAMIDDRDAVGDVLRLRHVELSERAPEGDLNCRGRARRR